MISSVHILNVLEEYLCRFPSRRETLRDLYALILVGTEVVSRKEFRGHVTCSAVVLDSARQRVLLIHHNSLRAWLLPGGHLESCDVSLVEAALRELSEEVGVSRQLINVPVLWRDTPIHVDRHAIPANTVNHEPEHEHWDFRFLLALGAERVTVQHEEVGDFMWCDPSALASDLSVAIREAMDFDCRSLIYPQASSRSLTPVESICAKYQYESDRVRDVGLEGQFRVRRFVDLMSAVHTPRHLEVLSLALANAIATNKRNNVITAIVGLKIGNSTLAISVARLLERQSGLVKHEILFDRWIEGTLPSQSQVLIVDDVASDGDLIWTAAEKLQLAGHTVDSAYVVVERTDCNARETLQAHGITLYSLLKADDIVLSDFRALHLAANGR